MTQDLEILKRLLAEADEEETTKADDTEELPKEEKPKKGSFEDDPMGFILKKYNSLNELLQELMTESFKEYLDGIFLIAPKPTTFKLVLHNGQYFFLTYMGSPRKSEKEGVYEATIEGKRYYLDGIGEKERCMMALAKLLRFGSPLKTKGPEGAEQSTRENTGMEGDWAEKTGMAAGGAEETGTEPAGEEAGAEGGEELKENIEILKRILIKEAKEDPKLLLKHTVEALQDIGENPGKIESKNGGPHTRVSLGNESESIKKITDALSATGLDKNDFKIDVISPNDFSKGARSGTFNTYIVTAKKDITLDNDQIIKKNSQAHIVSNVTEGKSSIAAKSVTPGAFGMNGKTFKKAEDIIKQVQPYLDSMPNKELGKALSLLMEDIKNLSGPNVDDVSEMKDYNKTITLSQKTQKALSQVLPGDLAVIGKDFGEVLGAILLAKEINLKVGVNFPKGNQPLLDFSVDGYGISSKYKSGAAATLTNPIQKLDPEQLTTKDQTTLYTNLFNAFKLGVSDSYLSLAKVYAKDVVGALAYVMETNEKSITTQSINDYIMNLIGSSKIPTQSNPKLDKKIEETFGAFFAAAKSKPSLPIKWASLAKDRQVYGIVMGPLSAAVARKLNDDPKSTKALKEIISKVEIKQLYFDFNLKSNAMVFKLKSFADPKASFSFTPANISVYNPNNGKMGFKMK